MRKRTAENIAYTTWLESVGKAADAGDPSAIRERGRHVLQLLTKDKRRRLQIELGPRAQVRKAR
jgi:hypothetical protein